MTAFLPIPAIDLMGGQVVRLSRGLADEKKVYSDNPAAIARSFYDGGARRLHVVDLDGAFGGAPRNTGAITSIRKAFPAVLELGGGLRTQSDVDDALALGVDFAILGTAAVRDRALVARLVESLGDKIIVGIDAKDGQVAVEGWVETSDLSQLDFARELASIGVSTVIATDIATDGMMTGPNLDSLTDLADAAPSLSFIASGGIRSVADLLTVRNLAQNNIIGAITGRAVYEGELDIGQAVSALA